MAQVVRPSTPEVPGSLVPTQHSILRAARLELTRSVAPCTADQQGHTSALRATPRRLGTPAKGFRTPEPARLYGPGVAQGADAVPVETDLEEHLFGVLAELGCQVSRFGRGVRQP